MPTTFGFPSSASRAMKQQILLEPTSTAAISPFFVTIRGFFIGSSPNPCSSRAPLSIRVPRSSSLVALCRRRQIDRRQRMTLPYDDPVRLRQVDHGHILVQELGLAIEVGEVAPDPEGKVLPHLRI